MPSKWRTVAKSVSDIEDDHLACRAGRHPWPILRPRRKIPRGINVTRQADGCFQIAETCPTCGTVRTTTTLRGGAYDRDAYRQYRYPDDWKVVPADSGITRGDLNAELWERVFEDVKRAAQ